MTSSLFSVTDDDVATVETLDRDECVEAWRNQFGQSPPRHVSVQFMRKALAFEVQAKSHGGHSASVRGLLRRVLKDHQGKEGKAVTREASSSLAARASALRPGTHLVREWNGRSYQVEVLDDGYRMDGRTYRSLTAIARKITGAHWSGPRFFGLVQGR